MGMSKNSTKITTKTVQEKPTINRVTISQILYVSVPEISCDTKCWLCLFQHATTCITSIHFFRTTFFSVLVLCFSFTLVFCQFFLLLFLIGIKCFCTIKVLKRKINFGIWHNRFLKMLNKNLQNSQWKMVKMLS